MKKSTTVALLKIFRKEKLKNLYELNDSQWLSLPEIKKIQNEKFLKLINHCKENVPYYRAIDTFSKVKSLDDITRLPFLTKRIIGTNHKALNATNYLAERFTSNSTSGSTGETLKFFSDSKDVMSLGILMRNNMWTGWSIGEKQAMLWGSHYDISKAQEFFNKIKNRFIHKILYLSSYNMTEEDMLTYQEKINLYKPQLITGYPTGLFMFASFLEKKELSIFRPKGVITSGETLYEYQRKKIESIFNCKVLNRYGSREFGSIAHQCERQDGLHINAEHIIVEIFDENGNACKPGELGEIVVTDLDNYVFPFIRYKIGDIGTLSDRICSCGRCLPLLDTVEGRIWDVIVGANGNRLVGTFWLVKDVEGIKQFQIVQEKFGEISIRLCVNKIFGEKEKKKLIARVHKNCGRKMKVLIQLVEKISLTESGKHRFIISKISPFTENLTQ